MELVVNAINGQNNDKKRNASLPVIRTNLNITVLGILRA